MRIHAYLLFLLFSFLLPVSAQETAEEKLQMLEQEDTTDLMEPEFYDYLADTTLISEFDTSYFMAGDPEINLVRAAELGQIPVVKMLIERGVDVNADTYEGVTSLMYASQNGDLEILEYLISKGARVNKSPKNGVTALLGAVRTGQYEAVALLLSNGAKVDIMDEFDLTPLMHASAYNYPGIVEMLADSGASLKAVDWHGSTPLMIAVYYNSIESADILLNRGADPDTKDIWGFTPLMVCAQHGDYEMAWILLDSGADPSLKNKGGMHALALAVKRGDRDMVELLLESGADINQEISYSTNSLSLATEEKKSGMVEFLKAHGARPNRRPEFFEFRGGMNLNFNAYDFMMGFDAGVSENKYGGYITTGILFRPGPVRVLRYENDTVSFQFWEKRNFWPITLGKEFEFHNGESGRLLINIHLTGAYTWGDYRGAVHDPDPRYLLVPGAGISWREEYFGISFDYQYVPLRVTGISNHRFTLAIKGFYDFRKRTKFTRKEITWF